MHHFDYEIRLLAEQRSTELMAQAEQLNQRRKARRRQCRTYFRSVLIGSRRPAQDRIVVDLSELPEPTASRGKAIDAAEEAPEAMHTGVRFSR